MNGLDEKIVITRCLNCPFNSEDNSRGYDWCNLADFLGVKDASSLPSKGVHRFCPLKKMDSVSFSLEPSLKLKE